MWKNLAGSWESISFAWTFHRLSFSALIAMGSCLYPCLDMLDVVNIYISYNTIVYC